MAVGDAAANPVLTEFCRSIAAVGGGLETRASFITPQLDAGRADGRLMWSSTVDDCDVESVGDLIEAGQPGR